MTEDYSKMSEAELVELQRKIEKELAERKRASKPEKLPSQKPRVEKPKVKAPLLEQMSVKFCGKAIHASSPFSKDTPKLDIMWSIYCVKCGHQIGAQLNSGLLQFFEEGNRQKPISACPACQTPLKGGGDVDFSEKQRATLHSLFRVLLQGIKEIDADKRELA